MPVEFGINVDPTWEDPSWAARLTAVADRHDLDLVCMQDHPYLAAFFDTWTLLATLVSATTHVRYVTDVANLPLRPPAMLAKAAATLDVLSGGRVELGLGAGGNPHAISAMGGPERSPAQAVDALDEAISVIRLMWSEERSVRFSGEYYSLRGVHPGPRPVHPIGIWLGAYRPRMLRLVGRRADGWMPTLGFMPVEALAVANERISAAAREAGRDPSVIRRVLNVGGMVVDEPGEAFHGPVGKWVDELVDLTRRVGMTGYLYWPESDHERQVELFAQEVVPAARAALA